MVLDVNFSTIVGATGIMKKYNIKTDETKSLIRVIDECDLCYR